MISVVVVGANGYSGEELCDLLGAHPEANVVGVSSRQLAGKPVAEGLPRLAGRPAYEGMAFTPSEIQALLDLNADFYFLALPHGLASEFAVPLLEAGCRVIDLSADFRLRSAETYEEFYGAPHPAPDLLSEAVYGLPELHRAEISSARLVASAGCYPTSILLPLVPLLKGKAIKTSGISVASASGVSGAGRALKPHLLFSECNENLHTYGLPKHRHLSEIEQELSLAADQQTLITFVPHLAPLTRGIHTTIFCQPTGEAEISTVLEKHYAAEAFVRYRSTGPAISPVARTNFCDLTAVSDCRTGQWILLSTIDNLVKGAAGQAVQNFNLMAGLKESTGLL